MQITLRRAANLQASIHEALKSLDTSGTATVSIFAEVADAIETARAGLERSRVRQQELTAALFEIRTLTGRANATCGKPECVGPCAGRCPAGFASISDLLAQQALVGMRIEQLSRLAHASPSEGPEVDVRRAERLRSRDEPAQPYGRSTGPVETMTVNLLTAAEREEVLEDLQVAKRTKLDIKDQLAEANATKTITLSQRSVDALRAERII